MPKHRVLIVEDERDIAGLIKHTLERAGDAEAEIVESGDAALRAVTARPPDLIILDLNLPVLSGTEVCRILRGRSDGRHLPIIMLTARTAENDRVNGLELGADDYVTKPFSLRELNARVEAAIARAQGRPDAASVRSAIEEARAQEAPWLELLALVDQCEHHEAAAAERSALALLVDRLPEAGDTVPVRRARSILQAVKPA